MKSRRRPGETPWAPALNYLSGERITRWTKCIFAQKYNNSLVNEFQYRLKKEGLTEELFAVCVSKFCKDTDERAAHMNIGLPDDVSEDTITATLRLMEIKPDDSIKKAYKMMQQKFFQVKRFPRVVGCIQNLWKPSL